MQYEKSSIDPSLEPPTEEGVILSSPPLTPPLKKKKRRKTRRSVLFNSLNGTKEERFRALSEAGFNTLSLKKSDVFIDALPDAGISPFENVSLGGTNRILNSNEVFERCATNQSFKTLKRAVSKLFGYNYFIPLQQTYGAEQIYISSLLKRCKSRQKNSNTTMTVISNHLGHIAHTYLNFSQCDIRNVFVDDAFNTAENIEFKGNFDLVKLENSIEEIGNLNVPFISISLGCGFTGGQPISLDNLKTVYLLAQKHGIPLVMEAANFSENAFFIKKSESKYKTLALQEIIKAQSYYADILVFPAKKEGEATHGGLLCFKNRSYIQIYWECRHNNYLDEQALVFEKLEGGSGFFERLTHSLYEKIREEKLTRQFSQVEKVVEQLEAIGVPCQQASGYAAFVDARRLLPHIASEHFPGLTLACEVYKLSGIRTAAFDSVLLGRRPLTKEKIHSSGDLVPIPIASGLFSDTYISFILEVFREIKANLNHINGLIPTYEPIGLCQNKARFKEIENE
ncbi:tryptophanase [Enterovibrio calviensis]|uniref:tryptophanase n=1 Tax=Enterovibrio calviensis TaxID=91359 RepID=UPI003735A522